MPSYFARKCAQATSGNLILRARILPVIYSTLKSTCARRSPSLALRSICKTIPWLALLPSPLGFRTSCTTYHASLMHCASPAHDLHVSEGPALLPDPNSFVSLVNCRTLMHSNSVCFVSIGGELWRDPKARTPYFRRRQAICIVPA